MTGAELEPDPAKPPGEILASGDRFVLRVFGGFDFCRPGGEPVALTGRRERALLAYLALQPDGRERRDELVELLWGDEPNGASLDNLRTTLWALRKALGDDGRFIVLADRNMIGLDLAAIIIDARIFGDLLIGDLLKGGDPADLKRATDLYSGELLEGLDVPSNTFSDWLRDERRKYQDMAVDSFYRFAVLQQQSAETHAAIKALEAVLRIEPFHEEALRALLPLYAENGRRQLVTQTYQAFTERLANELGVEPEEETQRAFEEARHSKRAPATQSETGVLPSAEGPSKGVRGAHRLTKAAVGLGAIAAVIIAIVAIVREGENDQAAEQASPPDAPVPSTSVSEYMAADELRRRLGGAFVSFQSVRGYPATMHYHADGVLTGYAQGMTDDGRWWVEPDGYACAQYDRWMNNRKLCFYGRLEDGLLKRFKPDGSPREPAYTFVAGPPSIEKVAVESLPPTDCWPDRVDFAVGEVGEDAAAILRSDVCQAMKKVEAWWGTPFTRKIRVSVSESHWSGGALSIAWRGEPGRLELAKDQVNARRAAIIINLMHELAPNQNRFLADGLATYAQELFAAAPSYPTYGNPLHQAAKKQLQADIPTALAVLDTKSGPERLELVGSALHVSSGVYAGSFVRYLIEEHGWDKFRALYAMTPLRPGEKGHAGSPERWVDAYGVSLGILEAEWRQWLETTANF